MKVPLTVSDFIDRAATVYGRRLGLVDEPDQPGTPLPDLTYQEVHQRATALAKCLDELGIGFSERVAIVTKNSARMLISFFGVSGYGRILVPINFRLQPTEIRYILEHSGASLLLVDPELKSSLSDIPGLPQIVLDEVGDKQLFGDTRPPQSWTGSEDATATINYTSGTTAQPKGVQLTHRNVWLNATLLGLHTRVTDRDVYLHTLPMFHCNGWGMPFILSAMGVPQIVLRQIDGHEILKRIEQHGVTLLCGSPTVLNMIVHAAEDWDGPIPGTGSVRMVVAGAAPPRKLIEQVEDLLGWEFIQIYGLTETSPLLTVNHLREELDQLSTPDRADSLSRAGYPALGIRLRVDTTNEVCAQGNVVMDGYWNNTDASSDALRDGWFHTGDGGTINTDGALQLHDRQKDVIISGGENISSIEVEDILFAHPEVLEVAVIGVPDEKWGETVKALVVVAPNAGLDEETLITYCRDRLAHFKCPTSVEFRESLPRTATGKLQKFRLRAPYWENQEGLP